MPAPNLARLLGKAAAAGRRLRETIHAAVAIAGGRTRRRSLFAGALIVFLAYSAWMLGPYLKSIIVRDAAVTTWARSSVAPIAGKIGTDLPTVGSTIGADGRVTAIRNEQLLREKQMVEEIRDRALSAQSKLDEIAAVRKELESLKGQRAVALKAYTRSFRAQLDAKIANLRHEIEVTGKSIEVLNRIVQRDRTLLKRGNSSKAALDESLLRLNELEQQQAEQQADLDFAQVRSDAAEGGVFLTNDGDVPAWAYYGQAQLLEATNRARGEERQARAELAEAQRDLKIREAGLADLESGAVAAPPGSLVFGIDVAPDATVERGQKIITWIDCSDLMIDVPVADAELPLIRIGSTADVVLEGESRERKASVLMRRGAAATLDRKDLAAVAKGRSEGVAQVLLKLDADPASFSSCPVGRAAYVDFPDVGLIDILLARLRL